MNGAKENPGVGTGASENLAGELTGSKSTAPIGHTVENQLDRILWQLILGEVELHQLTPALRAWWMLGADSGRASRQAEIDRLNHECDRLYMFAFNPPPRIDPNAKTLADLERLRGNPENADRIEAKLYRIFAGVSI